MRIAVVTGNPKPASRTHGVALAVADALSDALSLSAGLSSPPGPILSGALSLSAGPPRPARRLSRSAPPLRPTWWSTLPNTRRDCSTGRTPSSPD